MKSKILRENTTTSRSAGEYNLPLSLGLRIFKKKELAPFTVKTSHYDSALLDYDSRDGGIDISQHNAKSIEDKAYNQSVYNFKHPSLSDDEGNNLNGGNGPKVTTKPINEDLGVWFGTKKKPKGSKQPKGPWVNICRKKEGGGHPPCGRPEAKSKGYPKCRAAGVASKMTDSQKKAACQQKRKAEKSNPKTGTGNKPKMVSYKPKNESIKILIKKILQEEFDPKRLFSIKKIMDSTKFAPEEIKKLVEGLDIIPCKDNKGNQTLCARVGEKLYRYMIGKH